MVSPRVAMLARTKVIGGLSERTDFRTTQPTKIDYSPHRWLCTARCSHSRCRRGFDAGDQP